VANKDALLLDRGSDEHTHLDVQAVLALDARVDLVPRVPHDELAHVSAKLDLPASGGQHHGFDVFTFGIDQGTVEVEENGFVCLHKWADYTETSWRGRRFLLEPFVLGSRLASCAMESQSNIAELQRENESLRREIAKLEDLRALTYRMP
jgi:hypothetical protein